MPPLSAHVNENRQGVDFKDCGINILYIRFIGVQREGVDWITDAVALSSEIIHLICIGLSYFFQLSRPQSAWPGLTVAAALLTSPFLSIPSTELNFGVTEIGHAVHWSLGQIEVKFESEVLHGYVQSLQPLQRTINVRSMFTVFRVLPLPRHGYIFSYSLRFLLQASPTFLFFLLNYKWKFPVFD